MGKMKEWLMNVSSDIGKDGDLCSLKFDSAITMIYAEDALWEMLDHAIEGELPVTIWNNAVATIDKLREVVSDMGAGRHLQNRANFHPIPWQDTDDDDCYHPGYRKRD